MPRAFTRKRDSTFQEWWDRTGTRIGLTQPRYWIALAAFKAGKRSARREAP